MAMVARKAAFRALRFPTRSVARRWQSGGGASGELGASKEDVLRKGAKRDPELYILLSIMTGAFALAGWHFSQNPTSSSSEKKVAHVPGSEPWNTGGDARYQYHPGGDPSRGRKDAPSALNEVIIPNVNLPKSLHEKYNKWGKEGY